jgi:hypothetical protein
VFHLDIFGHTPHQNSNRFPKTNLADDYFLAKKLQAVDVLLLLAAGSPCRVKGRWTAAETAMAVTAEEQRWMQLRQRLREVTALHDVSRLR